MTVSDLFKLLVAIPTLIRLPIRKSVSISCLSNQSSNGNLNYLIFTVIYKNITQNNLDCLMFFLMEQSAWLMLNEVNVCDQYAVAWPILACSSNS